MTSEKLFNLQTGVIDSRLNTFEVITLQNDLDDGATLNYYLSQREDSFKIFRSTDAKKQTVTSFERDLEEINPTPEQQGSIKPGNIEQLYLLNLNAEPKMYSLTYASAC